ncbi:MAG: hypothetical protein ACHQ4H_00115 [Ktedonobacterales bacterium]
MICSGEISEEEIRRRLGDALPLKFTRWMAREYLSTIRALRPRVIVTVASDDTAELFAALIACLLANAEPTVISMMLADDHLTIRQLGERTLARICSLDDLHLR